MGQQTDQEYVTFKNIVRTTLEEKQPKEGGQAKNSGFLFFFLKKNSWNQWHLILSLFNLVDFCHFHKHRSVFALGEDKQTYKWLFYVVLKNCATGRIVFIGSVNSVFEIPVWNQDFLLFLKRRKVPAMDDFWMLTFGLPVIVQSLSTSLVGHQLCEGWNCLKEAKSSLWRGCWGG